LPDAVDVRLVWRFGALFRATRDGAMEAVLALSIRYANDRVQFGRPITKFQAIQQLTRRLSSWRDEFDTESQ
jgi:acyl-CoA dehydrogenase